MWIDHIAGIFLIQEHGPYNYELGNNYAYHDGKDIWTYNAKTYEIEAIAKVENIFGCILKNAHQCQLLNVIQKWMNQSCLALMTIENFRCYLGCSDGFASIGCPDLSQVISS